ncbi:hypothetical protein N7G274_002329 [Stereocaulon virgatum]|uniref:Uncharacterized protein n=1 Tax=Stereocaulon virgatum TaxID=373712 RepID=A0ABR4AK87_9LECA
MDGNFSFELAVTAIKRKFKTGTSDFDNEHTDSALRLRDEEGRINVNSELAQITKAAMDVLPNREEYGMILKTEVYRRHVMEIVTSVLYELHGCWKDNRRAYLRDWTNAHLCSYDITTIIEELDWRERRDQARQSAQKVRSLLNDNKFVESACIVFSERINMLAFMYSHIRVLLGYIYELESRMEMVKEVSTLVKIKNPDNRWACSLDHQYDCWKIWLAAFVLDIFNVTKPDGLVDDTVRKAYRGALEAECLAKEVEQMEGLLSADWIGMNP